MACDQHPPLCRKGIRMTLVERRKLNAQATGGCSGEPINRLILSLVRSQSHKGSILDFGAGKGNLLMLLAQEDSTRTLFGMDIMERPPSLPASIGWHQQDLNDEIQ